ncbi:DUF362 domain-containing protein [Maridesulfovibrio salexigens]|uniref:DUF362 domain-containing protein n=1 Tax=Maridesulfovibrio salexigens (strain ATCC 14822 / DSM 2638 / NCIMB 8403 / VKM B-1763) TaxID=526222 RepID=C6BX49_MARSD|nr:DUF362 domain-containing protein [Maridesulfovibrio salexigens]ACS78529.1 protein of unknown function DUF362 [Maridesulfovibrio salexigens DSM 2638]
MPPVAEVKFTDYRSSVTEALDKIGAAKAIAGEDKILLKPNLVNSSPPPVTTQPEFCRAVIEYVQAANPNAEIVIGEGCGDLNYETDEIFRMLGYEKLAEECGVKLLDLNHAPLCKKKLEGAKVFPTMFLPEIAFTHKIISLPNLKAHSLAGMTGAIKNMMGFAPPSHYNAGSWKKSFFHRQMQQSVKELNMFIPPWLSVMDASVGLAEYHLGGALCDPAPELILASFDAVELDRKAAEILGLNWRDIGHLR